jgi:hypothetical protein
LENKETDMDIQKKYMVLDEESNASDYLKRSLEFLEKIDDDRIYLKWFTIAFHGAVYHFMLIKLHKKDSQKIFKDKKTNQHSLDREIISFGSAYAFIKNDQIDPYKPSGNQDACIKELNGAVRNQMIHFRPSVWAAEPWYFAEVCYPLLELLKYCIDEYQFRKIEKDELLETVKSITEILKRHIK